MPVAEDYLAHLERAAEAALASLRRHKVLPTTVAYSVWLAHHAGQNPALSRAIASLEAKGATFDEALHFELAERYLGFGAASERAQALAAKAERVLTRLTLQLGGFRSDAAAFGNALREASGAIGETISPAELLELVRELQRTTQTMRERTFELERQLAERDAELASLREDLARVVEAINTDIVTGIANRRLFDRTLERLVAEAAERGSPLSLLMIDIDHFKSFNDLHGHPVGDRVLRLVATKLAEKAPAPRLAARFGGEEFAVLLPAVDTEEAAAIAESIRHEMATHEIVLKTGGKRLGAVTLSIGVATLRPNEPADKFLARADAALYRAKRNGRNRVEVEDGIEAVPV